MTTGSSRLMRGSVRSRKFHFPLYCSRRYVEDQLPQAAAVGEVAQGLGGVCEGVAAADDRADVARLDHAREVLPDLAQVLGPREGELAPGGADHADVAEQ